MKSTYRQVNNFGNNINKGGDDDPLSYCLVDTMDKNFQNSPYGIQLGPRSRPCQLFMAERCANKWDAFCEYSYRMNGTSGEWPDNSYWPNMYMNRNNWDTNIASPLLTTGEQLLQNTAERRFCSFVNCKKKCEPFDPTNPGSPMITYYDNSNEIDACIPVCTVNPSSIDNDPVMDRMLQNPTAAATTLVNICNTARNSQQDLSGTKIGAFCDRYFNNLQKLKNNQ